jgi:exonuclease III
VLVGGRPVRLAPGRAARLREHRGGRGWDEQGEHHRGRRERPRPERAGGTPAREPSHDTLLGFGRPEVPYPGAPSATLPRLRVITWNVNRRVSRLAEQALALAEREPDVVALQEVTARTAPLWAAALPTIGLGHVRCSLDAADAAREPRSRRRTGVLVAARTPALQTAPALAVPWPETALAARVGEVRVDAVHVPNAANGWVKARTLQAVRAGAEPDGPRIICGDFNTPRREHADGTVISFARDSRERLRPERGQEWDEAELGVVPGLRDLGYADAFRALHGYGRPEPSWTFRRIAGHSGGWRLDHLFASSALRPVAARYHHAWRDADLSDHSALEADLEPR